MGEFISSHKERIEQSNTFYLRPNKRAKDGWAKPAAKQSRRLGKASREAKVGWAKPAANKCIKTLQRVKISSPTTSQIETVGDGVATRAGCGTACYL